MRWLLAVLALLALWLVSRRWADRAALRAVRRFRARVDRFKLTGKRAIRTALLADEDIARAVRDHASANGVSETVAWTRVRAYIDEIVPFFNILMYYEVGYAISRAVLSLFWKVTVEQEDAAAIRALPRESIVIYMFNHRSNADYVLAGYALAGHVSISYAVGEWARVFPLEYLFKSFGSYFIRRRYREPLYHTVLERYVQLITRHGVTQGIFPEGGLSRDGRLRPAKVGLLDYVLGVAKEPGFAERMYVIPVGLAYDRVLEDRTLLREAAVNDGRPVPGRVAATLSVARYVAWNALRLLGRRWRRYGRAAVRIGTPRSLHAFLTTPDDAGRVHHALPRDERLARTQRLADDLMTDIARLVPVTPVTLVCATLRTFPAEYVTRAALLGRLAHVQDALIAQGAAVVRAERDVADTFDVAYRMLRMRRVIARVGDGFLILPDGRPLIDYYANAVAYFTDALSFDEPRPI